MGEICNYINDIAFVSAKHLQLPPMQQSVINFSSFMTVSPKCPALGRTFCPFLFYHSSRFLVIGHNWSHPHYFHYGSNNPEDITCFNFDKFVTLPWFVLMTAGLSLSCSNKPLNNFPSKVINK